MDEQGTGLIFSCGETETTFSWLLSITYIESE